MTSPVDRDGSATATLEARLRDAVALLRAGDLDACGQRLDKLLAEAPAVPAVHQLAAQWASRRRLHGRALRHMEEACRLAPERPDIHFQLACLQAHHGHLEAAIGHFRTATGRRPDFADAWRHLGGTLARARRDEEAIAALRRAHQLAPGDPAVLRALAEVEFRSGWPADALPAWQALLDQRPGDVQARLRTGETLARLGYQARAVAVFREGVALLPESDAMWLALAQAEEDAGDRDAARLAYERALALHPDWPFAIACLLGVLRGEAPEPLAGRASALLADAALADDDRALLGYALGKVHDARAEYPRAMDYWHRANAARRRVAGEPEPASFRQRVDDIIAAFPADLFATRAGSAVDDDRFVFIVGMPRSGTTLTEQILASHPAIHGCGELPDLAMAARRLGTDFPAAIAWPRSSALLAPGALREAIDRYASAATRHAPADAFRLVDKEPLDFLHLGLVALMFPRARVVWCRRDPRDIAVSIYGENFALDETLATDLSAIGHYIAQQARLMRHWQATLPLPIVECHYEDLVAAPEAQARRLVAAIGLPWHPACMDFHSSTRAVQSPSRWQVRQPVHARSVGRWRHYVEALAPLFEVLGIDATTPQASTPSRWESGS